MPNSALTLPPELARFFADEGARFALVPVKSLRFDPVFRTICAENTCGKFGRCWTCPPDVGEPEALKARVLAFDTVAVVSKVYTVEDAFDLAGMLEAGKAHNRLSLRIQRKARSILPDCLVTGAGACTLCETCTRPDNVPCRFPDEALVSLEAFGIDVLALATEAGLPYQGEKNTVAYFSAVLYRQADLI